VCLHSNCMHASTARMCETACMHPQQQQQTRQGRSLYVVSGWSLLLLCCSAQRLCCMKAQRAACNQSAWCL
jgi:hypothetical protein